MNGPAKEAQEVKTISDQWLEVLGLFPTFSMMARSGTFEGRASKPARGSSTMLRQLGHFRGRRRGRQMELLLVDVVSKLSRQVLQKVCEQGRTRGSEKRE